MKKAAGVSDVDEVVRRFETQEETANHLQELQARAEKEIREEDGHSTEMEFRSGIAAQSFLISMSNTIEPLRSQLLGAGPPHHKLNLC